MRGRRLVGDVDEPVARRLGEDRRRLAGLGDVDGAGIQRLEHLRAGGELGPFHRVAERRQLRLEHALALDEDERAVFLEADTNLLVLRVQRYAPRGKACREREAEQSS